MAKARRLSWRLQSWSFYACYNFKININSTTRSRNVNRTWPVNLKCLSRKELNLLVMVDWIFKAVNLSVFLAQPVYIFFQWISLASDFTCLFCKVPWIWICGSVSAFDKHSLRGQSLDSRPFCWRFVNCFIFIVWLSPLYNRTLICMAKESHNLPLVYCRKHWLLKM